MSMRKCLIHFTDELDIVKCVSNDNRFYVQHFDCQNIIVEYSMNLKRNKYNNYRTVVESLK